jgi:hypothetical protein
LQHGGHRQLLHHFNCVFDLQRKRCEQGQRRMRLARTKTNLLSPPGTWPFTNSTLCMPSTRKICSPCVVTRSSPMCPAIFLPLKTRDGCLRWPVEPIDLRGQ